MGSSNPPSTFSDIIWNLFFFQKMIIWISGIMLPVPEYQIYSPRPLFFVVGQYKFELEKCSVELFSNKHGSLGKLCP
jgi:hypothetical protein